MHDVSQVQRLLTKSKGDVGVKESNPDDKMTTPEFLDALDEVHTRFILNLPPEELATADRLFFQMEQAWWFYEDMICDQLADDDPVKAQLPALTGRFGPA